MVSQSNLRLNNSQIKFNKSLSHARVALEGFQTFNGLETIGPEIENITDTIFGCFVIHNLTQIKEKNIIDYCNAVAEVTGEDQPARQRKEICNQFCVRGERFSHVLTAYIIGEK